MLTVITPAPSQRLTTIDAMNREIGNTSGDNSFTFSLIDAASSVVSDLCNRVFGRETVEQKIRLVRPTDVIILRRCPVVEVASITLDGEALTTDEYEINSENGLLHRLSGDRRGAWPWGLIVITYTGGYLLPGQTNCNLPARVERATLELARTMWHSSRRDPLLRSEEIPSVISATYTTSENAAEIPPSVIGLLEGLRLVEFA
jgi:hypothetical protein